MILWNGELLVNVVEGLAHQTDSNISPDQKRCTFPLRNSNFTLYCDHSALVHIMNGKKEPPTLRLKKLIENLSDYKFDIKFLRGKDMFVSDFLSRHPDNEVM